MITTTFGAVAGGSTASGQSAVDSRYVSAIAPRNGVQACGRTECGRAAGRAGRSPGRRSATPDPGRSVERDQCHADQRGDEAGDLAVGEPLVQEDHARPTATAGYIEPATMIGATGPR